MVIGKDSKPEQQGTNSRANLIFLPPVLKLSEKAECDYHEFFLFWEM